MNETMVTVVGNVINEPTLRVTSGGTRVTSFRLASTERRYDKGLGAWRDGDTVYWGVSCWRHMADNVAASLDRGQPVVVFGRLRQRDYEVEGQRRTSLEIDALTVGHDLTRGTARFDRAPRRSDPGDGAEQRQDTGLAVLAAPPPEQVADGSAA